MGGLSLSANLVLLAAAGSLRADPVMRWNGFIAEASARTGVPEDWIRRVMRAESGGEPRQGGRPTLSPAGAMGLMQLMPGTWREVRAQERLGQDPNDPRDNILAGAAYLRAMYDRFGYPGLFAAYHAGPARYAAFLEQARPLPAQTLDYIAKLGGGPPGQRQIRKDESGGIFAVDHRPSASRPSDPPARSGLFVALVGVSL